MTSKEHIKKVRIALIENDLTVTMIGRRFGFNYCHISNIIAGRRRHHAIERYLAALVGLPWREVFGTQPRNRRRAA